MRKMKRTTVIEIRKWLKSLEEFRFRKVRVLQMRSNFNWEQFQLGATLLRRESGAPTHHLGEPRSQSWVREGFSHGASNDEIGSQKDEKSVLRLVGRLRVVGSCSYFAGIEYSCTLQVVKVSDRLDKFYSEIVGV